jgi:hypothetical protein
MLDSANSHMLRIEDEGEFNHKDHVDYKVGAGRDRPGS